MTVIVVLTLSASAMARAPSTPILLYSKLHNIIYTTFITIALSKVFIDEAHMSGSEIDDGTEKATAWKRRLDIIILKLRKQLH
jgi:hypothetical protein